MKAKKLYLVLLIGLLLIVGCGKKEEEKFDGKIISFSYSYSSTKGIYRDYKIQSNNQDTEIYSYGNDTTTYNVKKNVDKKYIEELEKIVEKYKVKEWNGFNKQEDVDEGLSFSLEIGFTDGKNLYATGFEIYPEGYEDFQKEFINLFNSIE